jgi:hypothetical protein
MVAEIEAYLSAWVGADPGALLFTGPKSEALRRATFEKAWQRARSSVGVKHLHFHDYADVGLTTI